jgi:hypothetical protein
LSRKRPSRIRPPLVIYAGNPDGSNMRMAIGISRELATALMSGGLCEFNTGQMAEGLPDIQVQLLSDNELRKLLSEPGFMPDHVKKYRWNEPRES